MEREPIWAGGRFRLRRKAARAGVGLPLWARFGLRLHWPAGLALALIAVIAAAIACGLVAAAVFLPDQAR